jgi:hypothetical protein
MRTRANFGIIGPAQTLNAASTGRMFSAEDQRIAKDSGNWIGPPGAPTIGTVTIVGTTATIPFTAPANNGGYAISSYTVISNPGNLTATGSSSPLTISGLTAGTSYTFSVRATNSYGTGSLSTNSNSVTPVSLTFSISPSVSGKSTWNLGTDGPLSLSTAGTWTITPTATGAAVIKMWGAAGGAGGSSPGGPGGYTTGTYSFANTSQSFSVVVGGGGTASTSAPYGAGGGGGYSGLFLGTGAANITRAGALLVAGGGGGGVLDNASGYGGAGGGSSGTAGVGGANGTGGPGTQSAGGTAGGGRASGEAGGPLEGLNIGNISPPERPSGGKGGSNSGYSPFVGGGAAGGTPGGGGQAGTRSGDYGGPGGGGGYYGGGGGGSGGSGDGSAAGGGSGYIGGTGITSATTTAGSGLTPANNSDSVRGSAGSPVALSNGNPGLVYITLA